MENIQQIFDEAFKMEKESPKDFTYFIAFFTGVCKKELQASVSQDQLAILRKELNYYKARVEARGKAEV